MVYESRVGDVFVLGASSWRIEDITPDRVLVLPAPGQPGKLPFWHGDTASRPIEFGRAIGEFQAVQHQCADMLVYTESSRSAAYYAAYAIQEGIPEARLAVSVAKAYASDAYREVGNRAIQVHGGMGFTWENDVHLFYRRAPGWRDWHTAMRRFIERGSRR